MSSTFVHPISLIGLKVMVEESGSRVMPECMFGCQLESSSSSIIGIIEKGIVIIPIGIGTGRLFEMNGRFIDGSNELTNHKGFSFGSMRGQIGSGWIPWYSWRMTIGGWLKTRGVIVADQIDGREL